MSLIINRTILQKIKMVLNEIHSNDEYRTIMMLYLIKRGSGDAFGK